MKIFFKPFLLVLLVTAMFSGCVKKKIAPENPPEQVNTLYLRLGQKSGIATIVTQLIVNIDANPTIRGNFAATFKDSERKAAFANQLIDQFCVFSNGPCNYSGKDMKTAHAGMNINDNEFNAFLLALKTAMEQRNVADNDKAELLDSVSALKPQIVVSLYTRLGGASAIAKITVKFIDIINVDPDTAVSRPFKITKSNPDRLNAFRDKMIELICQESGGPCTYLGKTMKEAHKGMAINAKGFDGFIADFKLALDNYNVPQKEKDDLVERIFKPMSVDIIGQ